MCSSFGCFYFVDAECPLELSVCSFYGENTSGGLLYLVNIVCNVKKAIGVSSLQLAYLPMEFIQGMVSFSTNAGRDVNSQDHRQCDFS